jgi:hypothetical protein
LRQESWSAGAIHCTGTGLVDPDLACGGKGAGARPCPSETWLLGAFPTPRPGGYLDPSPRARRPGPPDQEPPLSIPILVLVSVIERDNRLLVCRRPLHKRHRGLWEFPGGKVLEGESGLEAARRELLALPLAPSDRRYLAFRRDGEGIAYRPGEMSSAISGRRAPITSSKAGRLGTRGPSH